MHGAGGREEGESGFTLVELLVVVAVIAVLLALLLPALSLARQSAKCLRCASNARAVVMAWAMYADDSAEALAACGNGETWPAAHTNLVYYQAAEGSADIEFEHGVVMPYLGEESEGGRRSLLRCPLAVSPSSPNVSYVFSADLRPDRGPPTRRLAQIQRPCERIPMVEQEMPDADGNFDPDDSGDTGCVRHFRSGPDDRPRGMGNDGFADGHAATLRPEALAAHPEWVHLFRP
jgi:prepilin-type N-terminal cleavage/methylation domain-containing protein